MKIKVTIPTSLKDIKLSQYQKFLRTTKDSEDIAWINKQMVGIFCNLSDAQVKSIVKRDYDDILATITKVLKQDGTFSPRITHKGKEYGFIPKLDDITVGEQADIDSMMGDWQKMDRVMSILYRPITAERKGKYLVEDYTGEGHSLDVSMDIANGALVFFYSLLNDLLICTQSYMMEAVQQPQVLQHLEKSGVGIKTSIQSLEEMFLNLRMSLNLNSMRL